MQQQQLRVWGSNSKKPSPATKTTRLTLWNSKGGSVAFTTLHLPPFHSVRATQLLHLAIMYFKFKFNWLLLWWQTGVVGHAKKYKKKNTKKSRKKLNKEKKPKNVPRELLTYRSKGELVPPLVFWNSGANPGWSYAPDFCHLPGNFNGHFFAVCCRCCCGCCRCCCCCYWCGCCCRCRCHSSSSTLGKVVVGMALVKKWKHQNIFLRLRLFKKSILFFC